MKHLFSFLAVCTITFSANAQSLLLTNLSNSVTIANGSYLYTTTTATQTIDVDINFKNVGTVTKTYNVIRTKNTMNPGSVTNFCFGGTCYTPGINTAPMSGYVTLSPNADAKSLGFELKATFEEAATVGLSEVKYKLVDINDPNDTAVVIIRYNHPLSVNSINKAEVSVSNVFPNPATSKAFITLTTDKSTTVELGVYNALGGLVFKNIAAIITGKNNLPIDVETLNTGIYFVSLTIDGKKTTKRFVVN